MDRLITKTMAEIYLRQGHVREAYDILKELSERDPLNPEIQEKLAELKRKLDAPTGRKPLDSTEAKIRFLRRWLANIQREKTE